MKNLKLFIMCLVSAMAMSSCNKGADSAAVAMVQSEMARCKDASYLDGLQGKMKWNYTTGLELRAFLDVYEVYGNEEIFSFAESWYDKIIDEEGNISTYKKEKYNTDHICPGKTLFYLYDKTGKEKYRLAIEKLREQIETQPRTSEGGFWHKEIYPHQMWLDGLYMAQPFYVEYISRYETPVLRDSLYRDVANHFLVVAKHTCDPVTGLYRHAWDESREMFWADKENGQSAHAWGRAMGWYLMAIEEVLDYLPESTQGRSELVEILRGSVETLEKYADPETGMWFQVLDSPQREGNYVEATASAMFSYVLLKGVRKGWLNPDLKTYARETYEKLVKTFIRKNEDGTISLTDCCSVAGLGGKTMRSGTFEYYIGEPVIENDAKGVGPFIWASLEYERMSGNMKKGI